MKKTLLLLILFVSLSGFGQVREDNKANSCGVIKSALSDKKNNELSAS